MQTKEQGKISAYFRRKGFGFVRCDVDDEECFFHIHVSFLNGIPEDSLVPGTTVRFIREADMRHFGRYRAVDMEVIEVAHPAIETGSIAKYNPLVRFGFLTPNSAPSEQLFFHSSALQTEAIPEAGQKVRFTRRRDFKNPDRWRADTVEIVTPGVLA